MPVVTNRGLGYYSASPQYAAMLREVGLPDAMSIFEHPQIQPWRRLYDRENCTLDATLADGRGVRLHVKRFPAPSRGGAAQHEARGITLLENAGIPTVPLVAHGMLHDGRSFVITDDLTGFEDSEKRVQRGLPFASISEATARLAAQLHDKGLHHRDMYLCHFFSKIEGDTLSELRLIDAARVKKLPMWPLRRRWIVKDLAQFWYSTQNLPAVTDVQRREWLQMYGDARKLSASSIESLRRSIERKVRWIARHDAKLNERQPRRNISIPAT